MRKIINAKTGVVVAIYSHRDLDVNIDNINEICKKINDQTAYSDTSNRYVVIDTGFEDGNFPH